MITTGIILIFIAFANSIIFALSLFGTAELPPEIVNSMDAFAGFYSTLNTIFPVDTVLQIIAIQVIIELSILTYRLFKWGYTKIPGVG